jgi:hypothetical protein
LQQKCATLSRLRKQPGVEIGYANMRDDLFVGGFRSTGENIKVYLKPADGGRGVWKRVDDLEDIELVFFDFEV